MANLSDFKFSDLRKIRPSKNGLNLVIGFDTLHKSVRFWRTLDLSFADADVQEFPFKEQFLSEEFCAEFREICASYIETLPTNRQIASYLVMPDSMVTMDHISLPPMSAKKRELALTASLQNLYKNYKEFQFNRYVISSNRQYTTYLFTILRKARLTELYRAMAENKLYSKITTFSSNCIVNSILHFQPALRRKNFLFMDVHNDHTNIVVCVKGKTAGYTHIMLGGKHLAAPNVLQENMQYDHDVADLAILNAKEKAKMKQLTITEEEHKENLNVVADDVMQQLVEGKNKNENPEEGGEAAKPEASGLQAAVEEFAETAEERAIAEQFDAEDAAEAEQQRQAELLAQMAEARKKKVFARKMPKRLPKFMLRPDPVDREGVVYENFRMFIKWAILFNKFLKEQEYMPALDCVYVNLPEEYRYLIDRANSEEEKSELPFEFFSAGQEGVDGSLDMIGALYAGMYNKRENF